VPAALKQKLAVLAMKTLADGHFFANKTMNGQVSWETKNPVVPGTLSLEDCLHYAWSLPISVLITGAEKPEFLRDKAAICRSFKALGDDARLALVQRVTKFVEERQVEYYKTESLRA
jgi:hypothetical protein